MQSGPIFVGKSRWRYRWRGVRVALRVLWNAICGFELAGYQHIHRPGCGPPDTAPAESE